VLFWPTPAGMVDLAALSFHVPMFGFSAAKASERASRHSATVNAMLRFFNEGLLVDLRVEMLRRVLCESNLAAPSGASREGRIGGIPQNLRFPFKEDYHGVVRSLSDDRRDRPYT
jgi:hypothetical protein